MSWKEAQTAQYEYSDEEEYSDDEYEPVNVASWGNQTVTDEGTTQIDIGWDSLIDPSVKVKAGGVGSGQLHRRGANFKPLDEQFILNQRLGKPIPKALGGGKKKGKKPKGPPPPARRPPPSSSMKPPSSSIYRSRAPVAPGQGPWGSGELASTPFWEQPASSAVSGTNASKYATPAPAALPQRQQPPPQQQQQYQQPPPQQQQQYQQPPPQQQQYQQYQQPAAPPRQPAPAPATSVTSTLLGSSASKYATPGPAQSQYQQPPQQQQQQYQQYQQPTQQPAQPPVQQQQQRQPSEVTHRFDTPCLNFNIEMAPGINAKLSVYSDDDPVKVVDRFERDHNLIMSDEQKGRFADKVARLLVEYR